MVTKDLNRLKLVLVEKKKTGGAQLGNITVEETVRLDDGTEDVIIHTVFGCPQCNKSYEKELEKYRNSHNV